MPKKRSNGEGCFRKRPNGLWECMLMIGYHDDGRRKYKSFYARTKKEVKEKADRYIYEREMGIAPAKEWLFSDWADEWYRGYKDQVSATTYEGYGYTLAKLKDEFGQKKLTEIRTSHIERYLKAKMNAGLSTSYLQKFRALMFQIMRKAVAEDLIAKNPVEYADKMKPKDNGSTKKDSFTAEEIENLMQFLPENRIGNSIRVMLGTGMRTQEIMGLETKHIEPDGSVIHVRQAVVMVKGTPQIGPPKTKTSVRDIPVPVKICPYLVALREDAESSGHSFIWYSRQYGRFCNPSSFRKQFRKALEQVSGVRVLSPHCCRHTYVSQLQATGVPLETIQALSGHADVDMTEHYLHIQQTVKEAAAEKLNDIF